MTAHSSGTDATPQKLRLLESMIEHLPSMVFLKRADDLTFILFNRAGEQLLGYARADLLGKSDYDFFPKEQADFFTAKDRNVLDVSGFEDIAEEFIDTRSKGRRVLHTKKIALYDAAGKPEYLLGISEDITERKHNEKILRENEEQLRAVFDISAVGLAQAEPSTGKIVRVNPRFCALTGYAAEELIGLSFTEFTHPDDLTANIAQFFALSRGEINEFRIEKRYIRKDGSHLWVDVTTNLIRDAGGKPLRSLAVILDISDRHALQTQLHASEARYRSVVSTMSEGVVVQQADGQIVANNAAAEKILGITADQMRGRTAMDPLWDSVREDGSAFPGTEHPGTAALHTGKTYANVIMGVNHPGKGRRWISINAHPLRDPVTRKPNGSVATFTDITERRRHEEQIDRTHQILTAVFDSSPGLIAYLDPEMNFIRVNAAYAAADEKSPDYFPGKNHFALFPHTENEIIFRRVAATGIAHTAKSKPFEYEHHPERGVTHWDWTLTPIKDGAGAVTGLVLSLLNVTDRIEAIELAQQHEQMLATMMHNLQGLVYRCKNDPDWTMVFMSGGSVALTGYEPADFLERRSVQYAQLIHPDDRDGVWTDVQTALDKRAPFYLTYRIHARDGREKWVWERGRGIFDEHGVLQYLEGLIVDMTRQKQIEAELDHHRTHLEVLVRERTAELEAAKTAAELASRAKSDFLSRMSHELRTPMNAILGFSQVLELEISPSPQLDSVREIHQAGEHLLVLIDELLDLSRIEAGKMVIAVTSVPLHRAVEDTVRLLHPLLNQKSISLQNYCESDDTVLADPTRLQQILLNLLSNAAKYNRDGGRIEVNCHAVDHDGLRLSITDTGPGIPPEKLDSLFMPFERLGAEYSATPGTGIGLALVKQLTQLMGGRVGVDSTPGRGSTFWVELPLGPTAAARNTANNAAAIPAAPESGRRHTVLYVEDNAANLRVIKAIFRRFPHLDLISAINGRHGLELAQRYTLDAILLDIHLPDMNGYAVLKSLRENPATRAIPVMALSADALPLDIDQGLNAGFSHYLTKPVDMERLMAALGSVLGK